MAKKIINERQFNSLIYKMVCESIDALSGYNFESNDNNNDDDDAQNDDSKRRNNRRRQQVEAFFKQPGVNPAAYAYRLYGVKPVEGDDTNDMKNARSKFMKCLNHEKNEDGYEYAFTSAEINELFSMISGNEMKENKISLSESDIMYMVNKSVNRILSEAYSDAQYAHLAGQAQGALDNFGGKIKGFFNPKWKARKQRQLDKFARQSTGRGSEESSTKGGDNNLGRSTYHQTAYSDPEANYFSNDFRPDSNGENPYQITRHHFTSPASITGTTRYYDDDKTTYTGKQYMDKTYDVDMSKDTDAIDRRDNVSYGNRQLNRAFNQGRNARKGGTYGKKKNGTGTGSEVFKGLK